MADIGGGFVPPIIYGCAMGQQGRRLALAGGDQSMGMVTGLRHGDEVAGGLGTEVARDGDLGWGGQRRVHRDEPLREAQGMLACQGLDRR